MSVRPPFGSPVRGNRWDAFDRLRPSEPPLVSVIVPYFEQQRQLDRTLAALARQTHPADRIEIIVVDDGSSDAPRVPANVIVVRQDDDGFRLAAARNLGVRASSGTILCFLDADTAPEPEYVERMVRLPALAPETVTVGHRKHADFAAADSVAGVDFAAAAGAAAASAVAGEPSSVPVELAGPSAQVPEPGWLLDEYRRSRDLLDADQRSYRFVIGAVTACSRWFFDRVGGYDESFREYGGEDWEWAHRAWIEGAVFAHVPDAVAWHDGPDWAGRDDDERRRRKNDETLRLTGTIPVAGSRGRALRSALPDTVAWLRGTDSIAAAYLCVDSLLARLPHAVVVVPDTVAEVFAADARVVPESDERLAYWRPRVTIDIARPVRIGDDSRDLADAVESVGSGELGSVAFTATAATAATAGTAALRVSARRALLREERWGAPQFTTEHRPAGWLTGINGEPELAAYLGGWG